MLVVKLVGRQASSIEGERERESQRDAHSHLQVQRMDTLSRKHRLRQQQQLLLQQLARNKEIKSDGNNNNNNKENSAEHQRWQDWRLERDFNFNHHHQQQQGQYNNGAQGRHEDEQDFKVFKVSRNSLQPDEHHAGNLFTRSQLSVNHYENLPVQQRELERLDLCDTLAEPHLSDEQAPSLPVSCRSKRPRQGHPDRLTDGAKLGRSSKEHDRGHRAVAVVEANLQGSLHTSDCSTSSSRSTVNSSGFVSMPEASHTNKPNNSDRSSSSSKQRSIMVDHLNLKLANEIDNSLAAESERAPSRASMVAVETTLTRAGEFCYSTLCRDDFSSFIAMPSDAAEVDRRHATHCSPTNHNPNGPSLVGIHDNPCQYQETFSQDYDDDQDDDDDDVDDGHQQQDDNDQDSISENSIARDEEAQEVYEPAGKGDQLSEMLDIHMARMRSLLRLMAGDRQVAINDAFDDHYLPVSPEHRTPVEYSPAPRQPLSVKVTQEVQAIDLRPEEELAFSNRAELEAKCSSYSRTLSSNFSQLAAVDQIQPDLDFTNCTTSGKFQTIDKQQLADRLLSQFILFGFGGRKLEAKAIQYANEFLETYEKYQQCLRAQTSFAVDWHENWLFAHKRPVEDQSSVDKSPSKRARIADTSQLDLFAYSTLLLSDQKPQPARLSYLLVDDDVSTRHDEGQTVSQVEAIYATEEPAEQELSSLVAGSRGAVDLCRLMLDGTFADSDELGARSAELSGKHRKTLKVSYLTSYMLSRISGERFHFSAHGYLFESSLVGKGSQLRDRRLRQAVLAKLKGELETNDQVKPESIQSDGDQVGFVINLTGNVELVNRIPVIQFCAKISGSLPINVRWFRQETEIGRAQVESGAARSAWPLGMRAAYSLEQRTEWASLYSFKRDQSDIMFEIRNAHAEFDYNQTFRCVLENLHSRCESAFTLRMGQAKSKPVKPVKQTSEPSNRKRALFLRTWSQRTLHRPAPSTSEPVQVDQAEQVKQVTSGRTQTVGRLSASAGDSFGKDFPYHPENLLKRLQENKFSSATLLKRHKLTSQTADQTTSLVGHLELANVDSTPNERLDKVHQVSN